MSFRMLPVVSALALASAPGASWAQQATAGTTPAPVAIYAPDTGDAWIDRQLGDIDAYARRYPDSFLDEVARYANVRRGYVEALLEQQRWPPGDIYFACAWAFATNLSCRETVRAWSRDHRDGWKGVVGRLPIAPDNLHYRAVRHAIVASYDRWDRPIRLDAVLLRQLGDHAQRLERARQAAQAAEAADKQRL
ncbi:hypothetical protein JQR89_16485 [[Pseudomonas] boreopolis]|uniref:Secreted protein n=2 Tax=Pseudomonadota TaxID=1224 RepID=A0A919F8X3_9XANT|nr:hypothetical protein GCM10009090_24870 [[Pseudomonas] boreopolis]